MNSFKYNSLFFDYTPELSTKPHWLRSSNRITKWLKGLIKINKYQLTMNFSSCKHSRWRESFEPQPFTCSWQNRWITNNLNLWFKSFFNTQGLNQFARIHSLEPPFHQQLTFQRINVTPTTLPMFCKTSILRFVWQVFVQANIVKAIHCVFNY